jgi:tetratricopeptide (TPR) repeat protein
MLNIIGYCFSALAFLMFIYSFFISNSDSLNEQAIYWFFVSVAAAVLPHVKQFKYKDFEIILKDGVEAVKAKIEEKGEESKKISIYMQQLDRLQTEFFSVFPHKIGAAWENLKKTIEILDKVQPLFPDDLYFLNIRAYTLKNEAQIMNQLHRDEEARHALDDAEIIFKDILAKSGNDAGAWNGLGSIHLLRNDPEKALSNINKALEINPNYEAAQHDKGIAEKMLKDAKNTTE